MSKKSGKILIVDDNLSILKSLEQLLKHDFEEAKTISSPESIINLVKSSNFDVILLDMNFKAGINSGNEGFFWMKEILKNDPNAVVILITAYADVELAIRAMKEGAVDFIAKPWDPAKLIATLQSAVQLRKSRIEVKELKSKAQGLSAEINKNYEEFIGVSPKIKEIMEIVRKVAMTDANILISGENGTGKELLARLIHNLSNRSSSPFISVDIASLSETLFESELFGHEKGAFTDAKSERIGRFELATNGTLFLDEISNISLGLQAKLLSVLENRQFSRIGSSIPRESDFRLLSATNRSIPMLISKGEFREDLYFRINTIQIDIPSLRDRKEDIPLLVNYYLKKYSKKYAKPNLRLSPQMLEKLIKYEWPGNIRELRHTVERAVILSEGKMLDLDSISLNRFYGSDENIDSLRLEDVERNLLNRVLKQTKGNLSKTAIILGISRSTLYSKMQRYGL